MYKTTANVFALAVVFVGFTFLFLEDFLPVFVFSVLPGFVVIDVGGYGWDYRCAFGIDHLLEFVVDFAPTAGFEEGGGGAGAVAHVGNGYLDGVFVHGNFVAEDFGADYGVLCEVLGSAAANHEEACLRCCHLDFGEFDEVGYGVDAEVFLAFLGAFPLVLADAEAGAAVAEGGAEDWHATFVAGLDEAVFLDGAAVVEPFAEFVDELAAAVGTGLEHVG